MSEDLQKRKLELKKLLQKTQKQLQEKTQLLMPKRRKILTKEQIIQKEQEKEARDKKRLEQKEETSEQIIMKQPLSSVEILCLQKVFNILCSVTSLDQYILQKNSTKNSTIGNSANQSRYSQQSFSENNNNNNENNQDKIKDFFTTQDIMIVLNQLEYFPTLTEVDQMIWEINDGMMGKIYWYEFELMYRRCSSDEERLEPSDLYNIIQFLMYLYKGHEHTQHENELRKEIDSKNQNQVLNNNQNSSSNQKKSKKPEETLFSENNNNLGTLNDLNADNINLNLQGNQNQQQQSKNNNNINNNGEVEQLHFFSKTINFDNALELLFARHGKENVNQIIYDIFDVNLGSSVIDKQHKKQMQASLQYQKQQEELEILNRNPETKKNIAEQAFDKKLTIAEYLEIMRSIEFNDYKELNHSKLIKYNTPQLQNNE